MTRWVDAEETINSVLAIEKLHREPGSYLYEPEPCGWCLWVREHMAYRMDELGMEGSTEPHSRRTERDYICLSCAKRLGHPACNDSPASFRAICSECKMERDLAHRDEWGII